jgi:hypothetical protein
MADIRCPMCGKPNPADAVTCKYCQARLKPLEQSSKNSQAPDQKLKPPSQAFQPLAPATPAASPSGPDWLRQLRNETSKNQSWTDNSPQEPESTDPGNDSSDWLARIRLRAQEESVTPEPEEEALGEIVTPEEKVSEWLKTFRDEGDSQNLAFSEAAAPISETQKEPEQPALQSPKSFEPPVISVVPPQPFQVDETPQGSRSIGDMNQLRTWLDSLERQENEKQDGTQNLTPAFSSSGAPLKQPDSTAPDIPDWLKSSPVQQPHAESPTQPEPVGDLPSWLKAVAPQEAPPPEKPKPSAEVPDWVKAFTIEPSEAVLTPGPAVTEEAVPDWLKTFTIEEPEKTSDQTGLPFTAPPETTGAALAAGTPDWLSELNAASSTEQAPSAGAFVGESGANIAMPEIPGAASVDSLPDWISETPEQEEVETPIEEEVAGEELERAQLPTWLQALRPVEAFVPGIVAKEDDQRLERSGPLAGMRGVLPAGAKETPTLKPPMFTVKLNITEKQSLHASLLENMLAEENKSKFSGQERKNAPQLVLRLLVGLVLLAVLLLPLIVGGGAGASAPSPALAQDFRNQLVNLPDGSAVLLAFEYNPGLAGEMRLAARSIVDLLVAKKTRLAIISTNPSGAALVAASLPGYKLADLTANLGFLPAGPTSLREFANQAQRAVPYMIEGAGKRTPAWNSAALRGVNGLAGFGRVIVITDNADTGRAWIEQVQPLMGSTPLLIASSAQAAPVLQPYVASGQVKAILIGLAGGTALDQAQHPNNQPVFARSYQAGVGLAAALLVLGILIQGLLSPISRRKKNGEA